MAPFNMRGSHMRTAPSWGSRDEFIYNTFGLQDLWHHAKLAAVGLGNRIINNEADLLMDFDRIYRIFLQIVKSKKLSETSLGLSCIYSSDPHFDFVRKETLSFTVQKPIMAEPASSDHLPPISTRKTVEKYSHVEVNQAATQCSLALIKYIRDIYNNPDLRDDHFKNAMEGFEMNYQADIDAAIDSLSSALIVSLAKFTKHIAPCYWMAQALKESTEAGSMTGPLNAIGIKNKAMIKASQNMMSQMFCMNTDPLKTLKSLVASILPMLDTEPVFLQSDIGNSKVKALTNAAAVQNTLNAIIERKNSADPETLAHVKSILTRLEDPGLYGELYYADDALLIVQVSPETWALLAPSLQTYDFLVDQRRNVIYLDRNSHIMVAYTGLHVINPNMQSEMKMQRPETLGAIGNIRGALDTSSNFSPVLTNSNGYTIESFQGFQINGKIVLVEDTVFKVTNYTKNSHKDPCRTTMNISRAGIMGLNIGGDELASDEYIWRNASNNHVIVNMEQVMKDFITNPVLFNYVWFTDAYNKDKPKYLKSSASEDAETIHQRGVWDLFPSSERQLRQDVFCDHDILNLKWRSSKETPFHNVHASVHYNENAFPHKRITCNITHRNYDTPGNARLMFDQFNPFLQLYWTSKDKRAPCVVNQGVNHIFTDQSQLQANVYPTILASNITTALRNVSTIHGCGKSFFKEALPQFYSEKGRETIDKRYIEAINRWYYSLNNTECGQEYVAKLLEHKILTTFTDPEQLYKYMQDEEKADVLAYITIAVDMFQTEGVLVCDTNFEMMKAISKLKVPHFLKSQDIESFKKLKSICATIIEIMESVGRVWKDLVDKDFADKQGELWSTNMEEDIEYLKCAASLSLITDPFTPTSAMMGVLGSNLMSALPYDSQNVQVHCIKSALESSKPELYAECQGPSLPRNKTVYQKYVLVDKADEVFTVNSFQTFINYKVFNATITQFNGNKMMAARPAWSTTNIIDKNADTVYTDGGSHALKVYLSKKDIKPPKFTNAEGIMIVQACPTSSINFESYNKGSYKLLNACCIDAILVKDVPKFTCKSSYNENLDIYKEVPLVASTEEGSSAPAKKTFLKLQMLPIARDCCYADILSHDYVAFSKYVTKPAMKRLRPSLCQPEYLTYANAHSIIRQESVQGCELIHSQFANKPLDMLYTVPIQQSYLTPEGILALSRTAKHNGVFAVLLNVKDEIHTEHMIFTQPNSIGLRQGMMDFNNENTNGMGYGTMKDPFRLSELRAGYVAMSVPHSTFAGFKTDGDYHPVKYNNINNPAFHSIPQHTLTAYKKIQKSNPGTRGVNAFGSAQSDLPLGLLNDEDQGIIQSSTHESSSSAGIGKPLASTVEIYMVPSCIHPLKLGKNINIRNPGRENTFAVFAEGVSRAVWFKSTNKGGSGNPWGTLPYSVSFANNLFNNLSIKRYIPPQARMSENPIAIALGYAAADLEETLTDSMYNRKRTRNEENETQGNCPYDTLKKSPDIHTNMMSIAKLDECGIGNNLEEITGQSMRLASCTNLDMVEVPDYQKQNWGGIVTNKQTGDYLFSGQYPEVFGTMQSVRSV